MLIVNADDWGRSARETDLAAACFERGRITSVTAMVFMQDSVRAVEMAREAGIVVGLHLNLTQSFDGPGVSPALAARLDRIAAFLRRSRYSQLLYNPALAADFSYVYRAQLDEFHRVFCQTPSHIDGHHHKHLCMNMLMGVVIAPGARVRRNFTYIGQEKSIANRFYRARVDQWLGRRYRIADYLFSLQECIEGGTFERVVALAHSASVELMAHPANPNEYAFLMSNRFEVALTGLPKGSYLSI